MDQQTIITLIVSAIVTVLGFLFRYWKPLDPLKSWLEMFLSIIGAIVIALVLGKLNPIPGGGDPVKVLQYFLESAAVVFTFVQIVYAAVKQFFPDQASVKRAFKALTLLIILGISLSPMIALADAPQDWQYAAVHCSGFDVPTVQSTFDKFSDWYGAYFNLTTPGA